MLLLQKYITQKAHDRWYINNKMAVLIFSAYHKHVHVDQNLL